MKINNYGDVFLEEQEIFDSIYSGKLKSLEYVYSDGSVIDRFNQAKHKNADSFEEIKKLPTRTENLEIFDKNNQQNWFFSKTDIKDLEKFLYNQCSTEQERARVNEELVLFTQYGMINLLYYLKYLVDTMRKNNIVWGVGRGSSVASYVLYLIGVHKVNSLQYNLDIREFIK